jgi:glycosyltransferase involved in cell wall biosynthesis
MSSSEPSGSGKGAEAPGLSVVMPVHNALPHLDAAVQSILGQSFADFEFVILDDASTDGSRERLRHLAALDPRIRLIEADEKLGPVASSNKVAEAAKAPVVARMDADDISYPDRLGEQLRILHNDPEAGVVASLCDTIDSDGRILRQPEAWRLSRPSPFVPFAHGSMMYRRALFEQVGGYRPECIYWEDQDLMVRMAAVAKVLVIPHPLYQVRLWSRSTRVASEPDYLERAVDRMYRATDRLKHSREYENLLREDGPESGRVDPRVFIALGSVNLWGGGRPRMLRRLLRRGRLSFDMTTLSALVWAAWASASPSTLRRFLKFLLWTRGTAVPPTQRDRPVRWQPFAEEAPR